MKALYYRYAYPQLGRLYLAREKLRRQLASKEAGLGTMEVVVLTGILLALALIFNREISNFAQRLFKSVFKPGNFRFY